MKNKVLIKLIVPELDMSFDVFIPVNEIVWKIKIMLIKSISDLVGSSFDEKKDYILMNKSTCRVYKNNEVILNTDVRNCAELIIMAKN